MKSALAIATVSTLAVLSVAAPVPPHYHPERSKSESQASSLDVRQPLPVIVKGDETWSPQKMASDTERWIKRMWVERCGDATGCD